MSTALTALSTRLSPEEYLAIERAADRKSDYWNGEMFALAGASERHGTIVANLVFSLVGALKGRPCKVYANDLRLQVAATGLYTYPDLLVICGPPEFSDEVQDMVRNPRLIVEVLSPSTEDYDRGRKFAHYRTLPSLVEYLVVAQDRPHVERFVREPGNHESLGPRWVLTEASRLEGVIRLVSVDAVLSLREVYDKVELAPG